MKRDSQRKSGLRELSLVLALFIVVIPSVATAQTPWSEKTFSSLDETAAASVVGPGAAADEVLADGTWTVIDIVNDTNCDVTLTLPDSSGAPKIVIPDGTSNKVQAGANGGYIAGSAELAYMSGETCSTGSVYVQGMN